MPITPVVAVITRTPASPRESLTLVAELTSGPVSEASRRGKRPSVARRWRAPTARLGFPHGRDDSIVRHPYAAGAATGEAARARRCGTRQRPLRARSGARGV